MRTCLSIVLIVAGFLMLAFAMPGPAAQQQSTVTTTIRGVTESRVTVTTPCRCPWAALAGVACILTGGLSIAGQAWRMD